MQTRPDSSQVAHNNTTVKAVLDTLAGTGAVTASAVGVTPTGGIGATTVQAALAELDAEKQALLSSGVNIKTINGQSIVGPGNLAVAGGGGGASTANAVSYNPALTTLVATDVQAAITELDTKKQAKLTSGTSIKTINGVSILGSGNIAVGGALIDVRSAGADNTGVSDCTTIVQGLINANNTGKGFSLYFPPGKYRFNGQLTCTLSGDTSFTITGAGSEVSVLYFPNGNGIAVTYTDTYWAPSPNGNSFGMTGVTVTTGTQNTGTAVQVVGNTVEGRPAQATKFYDVGVRGETGAQVWAVAFDLAGTSAGHFTNCFIYGANGTTAGDGIVLRNLSTTPGTATDPVEFIITSCRFFFLNRAIFVPYAEVEGIHITGCIMVFVGAGVTWSSPSAESALQVANSHIAATYRGLLITNIFDMTVTGTSFFTAGGAPNDWRAIEANRCGGSISSNVFAGANQTANIGLSIDDTEGGAGTFQGLTITSNSFRYLPLGIGIGPGAAGNFIGANNIYASSVVPFFDQSGGENLIEKKAFHTTVVRGLSGSTQDVIDVDIPLNAFYNKPGSGFISVSEDGNDPNLVGYYAFSTSTKNTARFVMRMRNGAALPTGSRRYSVSLYERNVHEE